MRIFVWLIVCIIPAVAFAQTVPNITPTREMQLKALLAQALAEDVQNEQKEIDATNKLMRTMTERDWWIDCAKKPACLSWAFGK